MAVDVTKGFDDQDYLRDIRTVVLNPIAKKTNELDQSVSKLKEDIKPFFQGADVALADKTLIFHNHKGEDVPLVLDGMFREGSDLSIQGGTGPAVANVTAIKYVDGKVRRVNGAPTEVSYEWDKIVKDNQEQLIVGKNGSSTGLPTKAIFFKGPSVEVDQSVADLTSVTIPEIFPQLTATIPGGSPAFPNPTPIYQIELEGETTKSTVDNGILRIHFDKSGGGGVAAENFKGFFETLGDIESQVTNPINGKSYAFAKDSTLGGKYYTPYFYVNGSWTELKQDPALTYNSPTTPTNAGVFSIKPSDKITIDSNGQLDLDGLSTPPTPEYFHGFYPDVNALKAAVPRPTLNLSFAYVKHSGNSGWVAYRYVAKGSARQWEVVVAVGGFSLVDKKDQPTMSKACFGIYQDDNFDIDSKGILSLKAKPALVEAEIFDNGGSQNGGPFDKIKFQQGTSIATLDKTTNSLTLEHPQRLINYTSNWEQNHSGESYRGNLFFDQTSRTWMGWSDPEAGGGVDVKWTRLLHRNMSDEVKSLVRRVPAKAPGVQPGILGDNPSWAYNGVTYLDKDDENLPEDLKGKCGGYITTSVQDKDAPGVTIPQNRIQSCSADRQEGGSWVRRFVSTGSPGSQTSWSPWVRTSFSHKDIENHMNDSAAHKDVIRFYRVFSLNGSLKSIFSQTSGGALGGFHQDNATVLADNYGFTDLEDQDYVTVPYSGDFRLTGALSFSGYSDNKKTYPIGTWQILLRKRTKLGGGNYMPVGQFTYIHTDITSPYPPLTFLVPSVGLEDHQELVVNLTFSASQSLITDHPDLYLVAPRSTFSIENHKSRTGTAIARSFRNIFGNLDVIGDVGIKSHHSTITNPNSAIRVYGEKVSKTPRAMTKIP